VEKPLYPCEHATLKPLESVGGLSRQARHELGFGLSMKSNKVKAPDVPLVIYKSDSMTRTIGTELLLKRL
jgi:hypothetical protein